MRIVTSLLILAAIGFGVFWLVTIPKTLSEETLSGLTGDVERGEWVFAAAGCASCHKAKGTEGAERLILSGGQSFPSPFGTFKAPNISTDTEHGIGAWTQPQFINAVLQGVSPDDEHYFPAFPYTSYTKMTLEDAAALWSYMQTLPADTTPSEPHDVGFPFNIRRNLGGWKFLFASSDWVLQGDLAPNVEHGRYLVEALGHCAECHTPRNPLGGTTNSLWMGGAADPSGKGRIPAIDPGKLFWSADDIAEYLKSGFTPEFDTAGGHMVDVIENTSQLSEADRAAIAAYLKTIPKLEAPKQ